MPKLGLGSVGMASWRMYQYVLTWPNNWPQPTSSQKVLALATEATAAPWLAPETGQPVSVTQISFEPATATTSS